MPRQVTTNLTKKRSASFVKKLIECRKANELTQSDLAKKSGVPLDTLRAIEGKRIKVPGFFLAVDLINALDGDINEWI